MCATLPIWRRFAAELERIVGATLNAVYLQADVCRQDLLLEIEATAGASAGDHVRTAGLIMRAVLRGLLNGYDYLVLYLGLVWLGVLCLAWTPISADCLPLTAEALGTGAGALRHHGGISLVSRQPEPVAPLQL